MADPPAAATYPLVSTLAELMAVVGTHEVVVQRPGAAQPARISLDNLLSAAVNLADFQPAATDRWCLLGDTDFRTDTSHDVAFSMTVSTPTFTTFANIPATGYIWIRDTLYDTDTFDNSETDSAETLDNGDTIYIFADTPFLVAAWVQVNITGPGVTGGSGSSAYTRYPCTTSRHHAPEANMQGRYKLSYSAPHRIMIEGALIDDTRALIRGAMVTALTDASVLGVQGAVEMQPVTMATIDERINGRNGNTAGRPDSPYTGQPYLNTELGYKEYWDGSDWVPFSNPTRTQVTVASGSAVTISTEDTWHTLRAVTFTPRITRSLVVGLFTLASISTATVSEAQLRLIDASDNILATADILFARTTGNVYQGEQAVRYSAELTPGTAQTIRVQVHHAAGSGLVITARGGFDVLH